MNLYAESSALLSWLLGEPAAESVSAALRSAEQVAVSDLGTLECERSILRGLVLGNLHRAAADERLARLRGTAAKWHHLRITPDLVERARHPFPGEPLRTLHALHLASALAVRARLPGIAILSLDARIRRSAAELGFELHPA